MNKPIWQSTSHKNDQNIQTILKNSQMWNTFLILVGIYGFYYFPESWTSFKKYPNESNKFKLIREIVGDYGYLALVLILCMQFATKIGVSGLPHMFVSEVFPFKYVKAYSNFRSSLYYYEFDKFQIAFISLWHCNSQSICFSFDCNKNIL